MEGSGDSIGLFSMLTLVSQNLIKVWNNEKHATWNKTFHTSCFLDWRDVILTLVLACVWTILRAICEQLILKPIVRYCNLKELDGLKAPESGWKAIFYTCSWGYTLHLLFRKNYTIFQDPGSIWLDYQDGLPIPQDLFILYMVQLSFYVHSIYATLYMDYKRKDIVITLFHHVLTITLIGFSYTTRYFKIGTLVIFLHDGTDVVMEFSKFMLYLAERKDKRHPLFYWASQIGFVIFVVVWTMCRMYWFPTKVLYAAGAAITDKVGFIFSFNIMLWTLFLINSYWYFLILKLLVKLVSEGVTDERDVSNEKDENVNISEKKMHRGGNEEQNGAGNGTRRHRSPKKQK